MASSYPKTRLFVEPDDVAPMQRGAVLSCEGDRAHYLTRVMRLKEGDALAVFNGRDGCWRAIISQTAKKSVWLTLQEQLSAPLAGPDVWVCFAPIKFGRIDYLAQKITELGAAKLQPVITDYTQSERVKTERLRANAVEAAEQCERCDVPQVAEPVSLRQLLADWPSDRPLLFADESGQGALWAQSSGDDAPKQWGILIGPEGGFSPAERALIYEQPFARGVSLGPRILRADTAAITLLALSAAHWGDWNLKPHFERGNA